jgi:hypothetical protein
VHGEFAAHSSADVSELLAERFAQPGLRGRSSRLLRLDPAMAQDVIRRCAVKIEVR